MILFQFKRKKIVFRRSGTIGLIKILRIVMQVGVTMKQLIDLEGQVVIAVLIEIVITIRENVIVIVDLRFVDEVDQEITEEILQGVEIVGIEIVV